MDDSSGGGGASAPCARPCEVSEYKKCRYGVASREALESHRELARVAAGDSGGRGVENMFVRGDFERSCLALSHARKVARTTGFPVNESSLDETVGLPGWFVFANF